MWQQVVNIAAFAHATHDIVSMHAKQKPTADILGSLDLATLQIFVAVMRTRSFTLVARERNVAPSSISRTIASLEDTLKVRLFQRTTRRIEPTEAARDYCDHVELALDEIGFASDELVNRSGELRGTIRLTTSVAFGERWLVPLLPVFSARYPELRIELILSEARLDLLAERIDIAIRLGTLPDSGLVAKQLLRMRYHVCASPSYLQRYGHPRHPEELQHHRCLLFPLRGFGERWTFKAATDKRTEVPVTGVLLSANGIALEQCAIGGMGITLLPNWLVQQALAAGTLIDLFPKYEVTGTTFDTGVWLVQPSRERVPTRTRIFAQFLVDQLSSST